jgi:hypothetical protein
MQLNNPIFINQSDADIKYVNTINNQNINGVKAFSSRPTVNGTGVLLSGEAAQVDLSSTIRTTGDQTISGIKTFTNTGIFSSGIDLNNSNLINATPQIINLSANFNISGNYNSRMIMVNSATEVTGRIVSGNALGFNITVMQVGIGQIQITGSGIGIRIDSFNNQYRTAGQFATASILHTGSNAYIMYGNTTL